MKREGKDRRIRNVMDKEVPGSKLVFPQTCLTARQVPQIFADNGTKNYSDTE
jgi:hypothetical protein